MNPLDWTAGPFLTLYLGLCISVLLLLQWLRGRLGAGPSAGTPDALNHLQLAYLELAYLAGGPVRAMDTILVSLFEAGSVILDRKRRKILFRESATIPPDLQGYCTAMQGAMSRHMFHRVLGNGSASIHNDLVHRGYVASAEAVTDFRILGSALIAGLVIFGISKIDVGLHRHRPVGILTIMLLFTSAMAIATVFKEPYRTRAGSAALADVRRAKARAIRAPLPDELPLAFALSGMTVLAGRSYHSFLAAPTGGDGGGDGGSGCGGGGGGGGGCGGCGG